MMSQQLIHLRPTIRRTMTPRQRFTMVQTLENPEKPLEIVLGKELLALRVDTNGIKHVGDRGQESIVCRDSPAHHAEESLRKTTFMEGGVRGGFVVDYSCDEFGGCVADGAAEEGYVVENFAEGADNFAVDDVADSFAVASSEDSE